MLNRIRTISTWNIPRIIVSISLLVCSLSILKPPALKNGNINLDSPQETLSIAVQQNYETLTPENTPNKIIIPNLNIDLPIVPARVINGYWQVPYNSAAFGIGSAPLNTNGNTVIFAHARTNLFAPLSKSRIGDKIYVTSTTFWREFIIVSKDEVSPTDTSVVSKSSEEIITLYTCTGLNDTKRLVIKAKKVASN